MLKTEHIREQRVGVFVDVQNMYYSARNLYNAKVNFTSILKTAVSGRKLIRAIAYVIKADIKEEKNFFDALEKIGFEVKTKDLQTFVGGAKTGDWDFLPLVLHLRHALGCRIEVIAFGRSCSGKLKEEAEIFTDLDADKRKYLI